MLHLVGILAVSPTAPDLALHLLSAPNAADGQGAYDWHGDYVMIAVKSGNVPVLQELLAGGYELKWQQAQVRGVLGVLAALAACQPEPHPVARGCCEASSVCGRPAHQSLSDSRPSQHLSSERKKVAMACLSTGPRFPASTRHGTCSSVCSTLTQCCRWHAVFCSPLCAGPPLCRT